MSFLKKIPRWTNLLLIFVTLVAYLAPLIDPAQFWPLSFLGLAYPVLLLGNVLFILYWVLRKKRYYLFSLGCILAGFGYFSSFWGWHLPDRAEKKEGTLQVMTFNIAGLGRWKGELTKEQKLAEMESLMERVGRPDIFCLQESAQKWVMNELKNLFGYPHYFKEKGTVIFSEFPFGEHGVIPFENTGNSCIWGDLKTPKGTFRVYSAHLQSNALAQKAGLVIDDADLRKKQTRDNVLDVMRLYKRAVTKRSTQAKQVAEHMAKSPHPIILCGDFNDMPVSFVYRLLSQNLQDSFCEKGTGFGATFNGRLPALRIDYVLSNKKFEVLSHEVPQTELSDHLPVSVNLKWRD